MYSHVVLDLDHHAFEEILEGFKDEKDHSLDTELSAESWIVVVDRYKKLVAAESGKPFPQNPKQQLWGAIGAVFGSWMNQRAATYRRLHGIPEAWGTAVNVQAMVFGNLGETRRPASPSRATRRPESSSSTASSLSMRKARTWSPASARRRT